MRAGCLEEECHRDQEEQALSPFTEDTDSRVIPWESLGPAQEFVSLGFLLEFHSKTFLGPLPCIGHMPGTGDEHCVSITLLQPAGCFFLGLIILCPWRAFEVLGVTFLHLIFLTGKIGSGLLLTQL